MPRCAIIGAGLAGLTAAYQLRQELPQADIDVWEGSERIGGKLHTVPFDGGPVDMGAEAFLARRPDAHEFFAELGLANEIVYPSGLRPLLYSRGQTQPLPTKGVMGIPATGEDVVGVVSPETVAVINEEAHRESIAWEIGGDQNLGRWCARVMVMRLLTGASLPYWAGCIPAGQMILGCALRFLR